MSLLAETLFLGQLLGSLVDLRNPLPLDLHSLHVKSTLVGVSGIRIKAEFLDQVLESGQQTLLEFFCDALLQHKLEERV